MRRGNEEIALGAKRSFDLNAGDRLIYRTGGGGGYGPVEERPAALIARDRRLGFVAS